MARKRVEKVEEKGESGPITRKWGRGMGQADKALISLLKQEVHLLRDELTGQREMLEGPSGGPQLVKAWSPKEASSGRP